MASSLQNINIQITFKTKTMKKLFVTMFALAAITTATQAQEGKAAPQPPKKEYTKAEKEAMKAKKEADLVEAFKRADLTDEQQKKAREVLDATNEKSKAVKTDLKLTDEEKKAKSEELKKEKNEKLKEVMGEFKYKAFTQAQKVQREAAATIQAPAVPVKE
jgi:hypothetical protein